MMANSIVHHDANNSYVDLENAELEKVFEYLKCTRDGLSSDEVHRRIAKSYGYNEVKEIKENKILKFLGFLWNPLSWVMEAAAIMAISLGHGGGKGPDYPDFVGIVLLLLINSTISFIEENNAGNAAAALMAPLAPKAKVLRNGSWNEEDPRTLVPGDIINIKHGDIIPADARILEGYSINIDECTLTGASGPVKKGHGDVLYSGSTCKEGELEAIVIATGSNTFFGVIDHLPDPVTHVGHLRKVLTAIRNFCIYSIGVGMMIEVVVIYVLDLRPYRIGIDNLLVLLIGGIPIAMPTLLSVTLAVGSHRLSQQGAIIKRMTAIEELALMDVLCCDKTGTLTLNKPTVDRNLIEVFVKDVTIDMVVLMAARASRLENQDAVDTAIVSMLENPKQARAGIKEVHFLPFNSFCKTATITYLDEDGKMHSVSKGAPEQILELAHNKTSIAKRVHGVVDKFAGCGLRSLAVARQEVPEQQTYSTGGPWEFVALLPLFDPPRHDSAETIKRALDLGISVKMITGDQLATSKETCRRLGLGTNMYSPCSLFVSDELIENADGFAGVFPDYKSEIVKRLQGLNHICGMIGDGANDLPALKKADIGIAVADSTVAARIASDIVLTEPGLSVLINAVLTGRCIFQRMKNYTIYAVSITIRVVMGFTLLCIIWKFDFPPLMVLLIAVLNEGTILTISQDRVKPSPTPDHWNLREIFATGIILGTYLAVMTVVFYWATYDTSFFPKHFHVRDMNQYTHNMKDPEVAKDLRERMASAVYLQVSTISQALIFVTRARGWSFTERPGFLLVAAFLISQLIATIISATVSWELAGIRAIGWGWTGVIWCFNIVTYMLLDPIKFGVRYALIGRAWHGAFNQRVRNCFTSCLG